MTTHVCPLPWISLEVNATGNIKPCCLVEEVAAKISTSSLVDAAASPLMQKIRSSMLAGQRPAECTRCWQAEDAGHTSKRMHALQRFGADTTQHLRHLDLKLGNICNIKCRICGDMSSSQWATEAYKHSGPAGKEWYMRVSREGRWPRTTPTFWEEIGQHLSTIEEIEITGGEPLLIQEQFAVLKQAIDQGVAHRIFIHYNTNGTVWPEEAITNIWPHFKTVEVAFSIDNTGSRFEYERYPAPWATVAENYSKLNNTRLKHRWLKTQICTTVSKFNVYYLPEITDFIINARPTSWHYNLLHSREIYNISYLNPEAKAVIRQRIEEKMSHHSFYNDRVLPIINFMMVDHPANDAEFLARTAEVDKWRTQSLSNSHPELFALLNATT
ncbi:MAG: twitch domain-containing radical SAM protein [Porticoccaceae bacterium]